jgi:CHAD domain-containing protein
VAARNGTLEREVKLNPGGKLSLEDLPGEPLERRTFSSTYYDIEDQLLARLGITLRRRVENGQSLWQLKLPRSGGRLELERPGGPAGPPQRIQNLLAGVLRGRPLSPVAELHTVRRGVRVHSAASTADVVLDAVSVMENLHVVSSFDELEIELVEGDARALREIERAVRRAGAEDGDPRPKVIRVLGLGGPKAKQTRPQLQAFFERQYEQILAHDPGTRLGDDPEDLHDLRVAVRRLRAVLKIAAPPLDREWADSLRGELDWVGTALGPVRDLDVMLEYVRAQEASLGESEGAAIRSLSKRLERRRSGAQSSLLSALRSPRYTTLLDKLEEAARRPATRGGRPRLDRIATGELEKLRKAVRKLGDDPSDEAVHNARIKGKRARYAAELARPGSGKPVERFLERAKRFQDVAGEHQDAVVAEQRFRELAEEDPALALAAGRLVERQRVRKGKARAALPKTWKKLERAGRRAWR